MLRPVWSHPACWTELTIFRPGRIQNGMHVNTNTFQIGLSCALRLRNTHAPQSPLKNNNGRQGNKSKDMWFSYRSHVNMLISLVFVPVCHGHLIFVAGCVLLDWLFYTLIALCWQKMTSWMINSWKKLGCIDLMTIICCQWKLTTKF